MHYEDMDRGLDVAAPQLYDVNTNVYSAAYNAMITDDATIDTLDDDDNTVTDDMDADDNVDAVHVYIYIYGHDPKGRGKPSSIREPDGIG